MAFDAEHFHPEDRPERPVSAFMAYADLSPRQRRLYGHAFLAKERHQREAEAARKGRERAAEAMRLCGDSKARAFAMLIGEAL